MTAPRPARPPGASGGARGAVVIGLAVILGIVGLQILRDSTIRVVEITAGDRDDFYK